MSSAKHLFSLVVELKLACREHEVYLCLCHISGDRMIETGMDGWSRGNQDCGISLGHDLRKFVPLNRGPFELNGSTLELDLLAADDENLKNYSCLKKLT